MAVNRVVMAALVAILVTTTPVQAANEGWQQKLQDVACARIVISGALAVATVRPAVAPPPQVRSSNDQILTSLFAIQNCSDA